MFLKRISNRLFAPLQLFYWRLAAPQVESTKVLIEHGGKYFLIRETVGQKNWTLPGGRMKEGEEPADAARRKAKEEAGIDLADLTSLGTYFHTRQHKNDVVCAFFAHAAASEYKANPASASEAGWFAVEEIQSLPISETVNDVFELYTKYKGQK